MAVEQFYESVNSRSVTDADREGTKGFECVVHPPADEEVGAVRGCQIAIRSDLAAEVVGRLCETVVVDKVFGRRSGCRTTGRPLLRLAVVAAWLRRAPAERDRRRRLHGRRVRVPFGGYLPSGRIREFRRMKRRCARSRVAVVICGMSVACSRIRTAAGL